MRPVHRVKGYDAKTLPSDATRTKSCRILCWLFHALTLHRHKHLNDTNMLRKASSYLPGYSIVGGISALVTVTLARCTGTDIPWPFITLRVSRTVAEARWLGNTFSLVTAYPRSQASQEEAATAGKTCSKCETWCRIEFNRSLD